MSGPWRYYGGKQRIAPWIIEHMPPHALYTEPYAGGAAVFWALPWWREIGKDYRVVLNDRARRIWTYYRVLADPEMSEQLSRRLRLTPYSKAAYMDAAEILRSPEDHDDVSVAWAWTVQLAMSFASQLFAGWSRGMDVGENYHPDTWSSRWMLSEYHRRIASVYLECDDAITVIRRWDRPWALHYVDPPYVGADQGHYAGFTGEDLSHLVEVLEGCQGSVMLSSYDCPEAPGDGWERYEREVVCTGAADKRKPGYHVERRTEVLWVIDRSDSIPEEYREHCRPRWRGRQVEMWGLPA